MKESKIKILEWILIKFEERNLHFSYFFILYILIWTCYLLLKNLANLIIVTCEIFWKNYCNSKLIIVVYCISFLYHIFLVLVNNLGVYNKILDHFRYDYRNKIFWYQWTGLRSHQWARLRQSDPFLYGLWAQWAGYSGLLTR